MFNKAVMYVCTEDVIGEFEVIQGQLCDYCDSREPSQSHQAEYAVDGTERWWQSPPLSRGLQYNEVNLTISLGQVPHPYTRLFINSYIIFSAR